MYICACVWYYNCILYISYICNICTLLPSLPSLLIPPVLAKPHQADAETQELSDLDDVVGVQSSMSPPLQISTAEAVSRRESMYLSGEQSRPSSIRLHYMIPWSLVVMDTLLLFIGSAVFKSSCIYSNRLSGCFLQFSHYQSSLVYKYLLTYCPTDCVCHHDLHRVSVYNRRMFNVILFICTCQLNAL